MIAKGVRSLRGNATDGGYKSAGRIAEDENHNCFQKCNMGRREAALLFYEYGIICKNKNQGKTVDETNPRDSRRKACVAREVDI